MFGKVCTKCGQWKLLKEFHRDKGKKDGRVSQCKICKRTYGRQYYKKHCKEIRMRTRQYYEEHREEHNARTRQYHKEHREKHNARSRQYYEKHREVLRECSRQYYKEHREERAAYLRQYYEEHREEAGTRGRQWRRDNPSKCAVNERRRRARQLNAEGSHTAGEWLNLCEYYSWRCLACGIPHEESPLTVDHIVPLSKGGSDFIDNIQPLCASCNSRKYIQATDYR